MIYLQCTPPVPVGSVQQYVDRGDLCVEVCNRHTPHDVCQSSWDSSLCALLTVSLSLSLSEMPVRFSPLSLMPLSGRARDVHVLRHRHRELEGLLIDTDPVPAAPIAVISIVVRADSKATTAAPRGERLVDLTPPVAPRGAAWGRGDRRRVRGLAGAVSGGGRHVHARGTEGELETGSRAHAGTGGQDVSTLH